MDDAPAQSPGGEAARLPVGEHVVELEPPDICVVRLRGDLGGGEVSLVMDVFERFTVGRARAFLLIDIACMGQVSPEARRISGQRQLPPAYAGLALFGGTFQQQVVAKVTTTAGWLLRGRALGKPRPVCVGGEREARAWAAAQRGRGR